MNGRKAAAAKPDCILARAQAGGRCASYPLRAIRFCYSNAVLIPIILYLETPDAHETASYSGFTVRSTTLNLGGGGLSRAVNPDDAHLPDHGQRRKTWDGALSISGRYPSDCRSLSQETARIPLPTQASN